MPRPSFIDRFWARVHKTKDCWRWTGARNRDGYGRLKLSKETGYRDELAHRASYMIHTAREIPQKFYVLHTCDNPSCVRPDHLKLGTQLDNIRDMMSKGRARFIQPGQKRGPYRKRNKREEE